MLCGGACKVEQVDTSDAPTSEKRTWIPVRHADVYASLPLFKASRPVLGSSRRPAAVLAGHQTSKKAGE